MDCPEIGLTRGDHVPECMGVVEVPALAGGLGDHNPRRWSGVGPPSKWALLATIWISSLVWSGARHEHLATEAHSVVENPWVWVSGPVLVATWALGCALVAWSATRGAASARRLINLREGLSVRRIEAMTIEMLTQLARTPLFWWGWGLSWGAHTLAFLLPAAAVLYASGWSGIGVAGIAAANIGANYVVRVPVQRVLARLR